MGKSNGKKLKHCGYIKPHSAHTWRDEKTAMAALTGALPPRFTLWCPGTAQASAEPSVHRHMWEVADGPIYRVLDTISVPAERELWNGPVECACGKSVWLKDGVRESVQRFPGADPMERILSLRAKVDRDGIEALSDEDRAELEAIGQALIVALKPLADAMAKIVEGMAKMVQNFLDALPSPLVAELAEAAKVVGEKPDEVNTISLVNADGEVYKEVVLTPSPVRAVDLEIREDIASLPSNLQPQAKFGHPYIFPERNRR